MPRSPGREENVDLNKDKVTRRRDSKADLYKASWKWEEIQMTTVVLFLG